jgi:hypothetical protein
LKRFTVLSTTALILFGSQLCSAGVLNFSGNFSQDEDFKLITFSVSAPAVVDMMTTSFGDGSGGFWPVLTLFDGAGNFLFQDAAGGNPPFGCGPRSIDPISGACNDAWIQQPLLAGDYTLALTEYNNVPGGSLSDGFPQTGNGNFTGSDFGCGAGGFFMPDCTQRNTNWAVTISGVDLPAVPEPAPAFLITPVALAALGLRLRRRND